MSVNSARSLVIDKGIILTNTFNRLDNNLKELSNDFIEESYNSKKWEKWVLKNNDLSKIEKSIISGHYVFSSPKVIEIKAKAKSYLQKKGRDLDDKLKNVIKEKIIKILNHFRMI